MQAVHSEQPGGNASAAHTVVTTASVAAALVVIARELACFRWVFTGAWVRHPTRRVVLIPVLIATSIADLTFFAANSLRALDDGWIPLTIAGIVCLLMCTWHDGRKILNWEMARRQVPLAAFLRTLKERPPVRTLGTAVYLTNEASTIPPALVQHLRFHGVLHERVIILTFARVNSPRVSNERRVEWEELSQGVYKLVARHRFMEQPDTISALRLVDRAGLPFEPETKCYVVGRTTPFVSAPRGMASWRKRLYALMARNTRVGYGSFGVPAHRLLEVGSQIRL